MKRILSFVSILILSLLITACSSKPRLVVYLPNDYIDNDLIKEFRKEYNVKVKVVTFNTNEVAVGLIKSGGFDVVGPSDYALEELVLEGYIEKIDYKNYVDSSYELADYLDDYLISLNNDGFNFLDYAVPYFFGTFGIIYNHNKFTQEDLKKDGFSIIYNHDLETIIYDSPRDAYMFALNILGKNINDATKEDIELANQSLIDAKGPNTSVLSDEILTDMLTGTRYDAVVSYSGDAQYIISENDNYSYYVPENTNVWIDGLAVTSYSKEKELAKEFIKFMNTKDASIRNSEYVGYTTARKDAYLKVSGENGMYGANNLSEIYKSYAKNYQIYRYNENIKQYIDEAWQLFQASK